MLSRSVVMGCTVGATLLVLLCAGCSKNEEMPEAQASTVSSGPGSMSRPPADDASRRGSAMMQQAREEFQRTPVYFAFDRYDLSNEAKAILDRKLSFLNEYRDTRVQISGHCDERGTSAYNLALGERRANSAKTYLTTAGVNASRLTTISYGEEQPVDPGHTEAAWARNRRDDFLIQN